MSSTIIVDSGSANLYSIHKAARMASLKAVVSDDPRKIASAGALIFPGVGSFDHALISINKKQLATALLEFILTGNPFLGICLGMQLLLSESEESLIKASSRKGFNVIPGKVRLFANRLPVPHVGWNLVEPVGKHPLFAGLKQNTYFYFTHSFFAQPDQKQHILALTEYGLPFASAVCKNNILGVQFHPEKSGPAGLRLLSNFGKIIADHH